MICKDFVIEGDLDRVWMVVVNMVKFIVGSLVFVIFKELLCVNFINYFCQFVLEFFQGFLEGIIMLCVNFNMELVFSIIEKLVEECGVFEIEDLFVEDFEVCCYYCIN